MDLPLLKKKPNQVPHLDMVRRFTSGNRGCWEFFGMLNWTTFVINLNDIAIAARELQPTKRNIVSLVGKFYDPLGYLAPVVIQFKTFFK